MNKLNASEYSNLEEIYEDDRREVKFMKYYFKATTFNRFNQMLVDSKYTGKKISKAVCMLECINDTYIYSDFECTEKDGSIKVGDKFISLGNCSDGYNSDGYYTNRILTELGIFYVCYKRK